jgi:hypothetical protein
MNKRQIVEDAIANKKQLVFLYSDKWREVSPHKFGVKLPHGGGKGDLRVFGFQFDGRSHEGELVEGKWRCFSLDKCTRMFSRVNDGMFHTESTKGGPNFCMSEVWKEVEF